jgi:hypothetical protein
LGEQTNSGWSFRVTKVTVESERCHGEIFLNSRSLYWMSGYAEKFNTGEERPAAIFNAFSSRLIRKAGSTCTQVLQ